MSRAKKYEAGDLFVDANDLHQHIQAGLYVWERHRPCHPSWIGSQPYFLVLGGIRSGWLRKARITDEWLAQLVTKLEDIAA